VNQTSQSDVTGSTGLVLAQVNRLEIKTNMYGLPTLTI